MKIAAFLDQLTLGGSEKAAARWAFALRERGHQVSVGALEDGPRRAELEAGGVHVQILPTKAAAVAQWLRAVQPEVLHVHAPGHPHPGDVLGEAVAGLRRIPLVQTNIFGHLDNPPEEAWTDFRLFISWTSCVQAARRVFRSLDQAFFRRASVAVYPVDPTPAPPPAAVTAFRAQLGIGPDDVLFGRISRPDPVKWTDLAVDAFRAATSRQSRLKLLLREPPAAVAETLRASADHAKFIILPATANPQELLLTLGALDVVLHTSLVGESFGYGIAEPMSLAKPVVTNSVPSLDQAQVELVRHGECGFVASTPATMAAAMLRLAQDTVLRRSMGAAAQRHIRSLADPERSVDRLEAVLRATIAGADNPFCKDDLALARQAADHLDRHQFGHSWREQVELRTSYYRMRFHEWRKMIRRRRRRFPSEPARHATPVH